MSEGTKGGRQGWVRRPGGVVRGEEIEVGHFGEVRRLRGVILAK